MCIRDRRWRINLALLIGLVSIAPMFWKILPHRGRYIAVWPYAKDYGQYQEHLNRLDTLHGYYTAQEQAEISQRQPLFHLILQLA